MEDKCITEGSRCYTQGTVGVQEGEAVHDLAFGEEGHEGEDGCTTKVTEINQEIVPLSRLVIDVSDCDHDRHKNAVVNVESVIWLTTEDICKGSKQCNSKNK